MSSAEFQYDVFLSHSSKDKAAERLRADEPQRGCLMEERVLMGALAYESSMSRLAVWQRGPQ